MSENQKEKLVELLIDLIHLLEEHKNQWAVILRGLMKDYLSADDSEKRKIAIQSIVNTMLGGMGSLSDVMLHKEGQPLIEENYRLCNLLDQLYDECTRGG